MKKFITSYLAIPVVIMSFSLTIQAQDSGFIYGKVITIDDKVYEGAIRWGKEEVYWTDMFNAAKEKNDNIKYLSREDKSELDRGRHSGVWSSIVESGWRHISSDSEYSHQFNCQFGNIKSIRPFNRGGVDVELQNGKTVALSGTGYNDVGSKIKILDAEVGELEISWNRIQKVEFGATPTNLDEKFGDPLYGTVETYEGTFTGLVQWDHDERVTTDKLDGDTNDGDVAIAFGKIKSIVSEGNRSVVILKSGRELVLRGSNDVNSGNRGIVVTNDEIGRVDIPWREFKKVTFSEKPGKVKAYGDFKAQKELTGVVKTKDGESFSGKIIYDLDEEYNYEVLQGEDDELEYVIPFGNIARITPKNYAYSSVELKSGNKIVLGESQDVSDRNTGILVFVNQNDPTYILWKDVEEISFK